MSTRSSKRTISQINEQSLSREESVITWSSDCWTCTKQLKHYTAFSRRGTEIQDFHVHSFVCIRDEDMRKNIGYIVDLYEDLHVNKVAMVQYFCFPNEINSSIPTFPPKYEEIVFDPLPHKIHPGSIRGFAAVLSPKHFSKCNELLPPQTPPPKAYFCEREFKENAFHPFDVSTFKRYFDQPILICLKHYEEASNRAMDRVLGQEQEHSLVHLSDVEVLFQKNGVPCYWYRCKALRATGECVEVVYYDVADVNGQRVKEFVPIEVAGGDNLGLRHKGRLTVRPWPRVDPLQLRFELGKPVDVWLHDGWWEGLMIGKKLEERKLEIVVYIPEENMFARVGRKDLRLSKEWVDGRWLDLDPKPDIHSLIRSLQQPNENPTEPPRTVGGSLAGSSGPGGSLGERRPGRGGGRGGKNKVGSRGGRCKNKVGSG